MVDIIVCKFVEIYISHVYWKLCLYGLAKKNFSSYSEIAFCESRYVGGSLHRILNSTGTNKKKDLTPWISNSHSSYR